MKNILFTLLFTVCLLNGITKEQNFTISRVHYDGGGDWYCDPSSLSNLLSYFNSSTDIPTQEKELICKIGDELFFKSTYLYLTGHGNIKLSNKETNFLREHLMNGAFMHVDDNYGLDKPFRREIKKVFPDKKLVELPQSHEIFNIYYNFENGLPKIHAHDGKRPQAFGIFHEKRLILLYTYESDLGDGWENPEVHNLSEEKRNEALKMGVNIILFNLLQ